MEYEEKPAIGVTVISHVSCHGKAYYFYIGKDTAEAFGIFPEDKLEVQLGRHWKPNRKKEGEAPSKNEKCKKEEEDE